MTANLEELQPARPEAGHTAGHRQPGAVGKVSGKGEPWSLRSLYLALWLVVGILVLPPFVFLLQASIYSWDGVRRTQLSGENFASIFSSGQTLDLVSNSIIYAAGSAAVALTLGTALAWLVERSDAPLRVAVYVGVFASFATPGVTQVIGWILLFGPRAGYVNVLLARLFGESAPVLDIFSMQGMIWVEGLGWAPMVFLLLVTPFKSMDPSLEEAGSMAGARSRTVFSRITLRLAWPSVLAALMLSFIRAFESFEVPALLGLPANIRVMTTEIYLQLKSGVSPQYGRASAYAVLMLAMVVSLLVIYNRQTSSAQKFATITGKGFQPRRVELGMWRWPAGLLCLILPMSVVLPLLMLFWASLLPYYAAPSSEALQLLTLDNYRVVLAHEAVRSSLWNTTQIGVAAATAGMLLTLLVAWFAVRSRFRGGGFLDGFTSVPLVIPGVVGGVAVLRTFLTIPVGLYGTIGILMFAYVMRTLPFGMRFAHAGLLQIHSDLEESAEVSGASLLTRLRRVVLPLMAPAFFAGWIYIFLFSIRALSMAVILSSPGSEVISVRILKMWEAGQVTDLGAVGIVVTAVAVAMSLAFYRVSQRYGLRA